MRLRLRFHPGVRYNRLPPQLIAIYCNQYIAMINCRVVRNCNHLLQSREELQSSIASHRTIAIPSNCPTIDHRSPVACRTQDCPVCHSLHNAQQAGIPWIHSTLTPTPSRTRPCLAARSSWFVLLYWSMWAPSSCLLAPGAWWFNASVLWRSLRWVPTLIRNQKFDHSVN